MSYLAVLASNFKNLCHISAVMNLLYCKVGAKIKILDFGTKSDKYGYFWAKTWIKNCDIWDPRSWLGLIKNFK